AEVPAGANYTVDSITWAPSAAATTTVYTATIVVAAAEGYMFTDATTFSLNGEAVDADVKSLKATIVKEFAATEAPVEVVVALSSAAEITENDGTLELAATVTPANEGDAVAPTTVTWAITGGDEGIATLEGNVLTAKFNGTVKVTATPDYDASQAKEFDIVISGQTAFAVNYDKNTGAEVANMPENTMVKGVYSIPAGTPTREGFFFEGWMTVPEDGDIVSGDYAVTENVTFYAKWSKGGYFNSFDGASDRINSAGNTLIATDGNYFETDLRFASDFTANSEEGYISLVPKLGGTNGTTADHRLAFKPQSTLDISGTNKVILGFRTNYAGALRFDFWYATKDADGDWIAKGNVDGGAEYVANHFNGSVTTNGDTSKVFEYAVDMSQRPLWDGFLDHVRIGNPDAAFVGSTMYYEYIKIPGKDSVEHIALNIDAPVAADVAYGLEAVTAGSDKYVATGITWGGSELLGGMYYDSNKAYTAKVEIEAASAYALSETPATVTVNGEEAAVVVEDGKIFVVYTFDATEDIGVLELVDITLHEKNDMGTVDEVKQVFKNRDVDMNLIHPTNLPSGNRWMGWSETEDGVAIEGILNTDEPKEYYALYEIIDEYDFSEKFHKNTDNVKATDGLVAFDGAWTVVTPKSDDSAAALTLDGMYISSTRFDYVEVIYDGGLEDANNANKFSETATPVLKVWGADSDSYTAVLVKAEPLVASNRVAYKYTYDIVANGKPAMKWLK
ncbi:MAG: InlB B-repeat-containing protein, partial [Clostridia bacterium]|nr:InlB B-repeat-containing protein [Clostridia bacterium]